MSLVVRAESAADVDKPPNYWLVQDEQITVKNRDLRSDKPDEFYHLSLQSIPPSETTTASDKSEQSSIVSFAHSPISASAPSPESFESDGEFLSQINLHDKPGISAQVYDLSNTVNRTTSSISVAYTDSIPVVSLTSQPLPSLPLVTTTSTAHNTVVSQDVVPLAPYSSPGVHYTPPIPSPVVVIPVALRKIWRIL